MPMICSGCNYHTPDSSEQACPRCGNNLQFTLLGPLGGEPVGVEPPSEQLDTATLADSTWSYNEVKSEGLKRLRWVLIPCAGLVLLIGLTVTWFQLQGLYLLYQSKHWPTTKGRVVESRFHRKLSGGRRHRRKIEYEPRITYTYNAGGKTYTSKYISYGNAFGNNRGFPEDYRWKYSDNARVTVHYDPADPGRAVLETQMLPGAATTLTIGFVTSLVSLLTISYLCLPTAREAVNDLGAGLFQIRLVKNLLGAK